MVDTTFSKKTSLATAVVVASLMLAVSASGASAQGIDKKLRLGLELGVLELDVSDDEETNVQLGFTPYARNPGYRLNVPSWGIDIGYGLSESWLLGIRVSFGVNSYAPPDGASISYTVLSAFGHIDYLLPTWESSFFFIGPQAGLRSSSGNHTAYEAFQSEAPHRAVSMTQSGFGGELGLIWFMSKGFSVESRASFLRLWGTEDNAEDKHDVDDTYVDLLFGLMGWI